MANRKLGQFRLWNLQISDKFCGISNEKATLFALTFWPSLISRDETTPPIGARISE